MAAIATRWLAGGAPASREVPIAVELDMAEVFRQHGSFVLRRIRRFYGPEEAEDVLQEVFVRLLSTSSGWRGDAALTTWLYQVTTRYCLTRLQGARNRRSLLEELGDPEWAAPAPAPDAEAAVFLGELWRDLPEELAMIGVYYFVDDMPHAAIAEVLGCSRRTVGNRLAELQEIARSRAGREPHDAR